MKLLLFALLILPSAQASSAPLKPARFETDLHFALFPNTPWTETDILRHVESARPVLLQCELRIRSVTVHYVSSIELPEMIFARQHYLPNGLMEIREKTRELPHPTIYLANKFADSEQAPLTRAIFRLNAPPCPPELHETIWIPYYVNSKEYADERKHSPYSVLAHELTHLFTLDGQHNNDLPRNQLSTWRERTNLLTEQHCHEIHESPLVRPIGAGAK